MFDKEFIPFAIFFIICFILAIILAVLAYSVAPAEEDLEKLSSYECGFDPFEIARIKFDIHFYLIAILFIVFDLEIIFLFPWCAANNISSYENFWSILIFLLVLTIGFVYEWTKGALTWK